MGWWLISRRYESASQNIPAVFCKWAAHSWLKIVPAKSTPSLPLTQSVKRAAVRMPVCSHALSTTMAPSHSPQQAAMPLRCWVNTMVSKHKQTTGICLLFDLLPPITSWEPLPCECEVVGASAVAPTVKLHLNTDQCEASSCCHQLTPKCFFKFVWKGSRKLPHPNIS